MNWLLCSLVALGVSVALLGCSRSEETPYGQVLTPPPLIVVDQFGYLPSAPKVAVLRDPIIGYDSQLSYVPGERLELIDHTNGRVVYRGPTIAWRDGQTDIASGDKAWWFNFSEYRQPGRYHIRDPKTGVHSPAFRIADDVYQPVLKHAMRTFFYQRAGFAKLPPYTSPAWQDQASHVGPGQDTQARLYSEPDNPNTERDLSGGWYDAGDYHRYTAWHANNIITLLHAYVERPSAWGDDYNIPESGNGIPDIVDELFWGLQWQEKMQNSDGGVLSILSVDHASPPSAASGPSVYGPASTHATLMAAASFAFAAHVLRDTALDPSHIIYAEQLLQRAERAWQWSIKNPEVTFYNNQADTAGVGAGQQETSQEGRASDQRRAAVYLYAATGKARYHDYIQEHYQHTALIAWGGHIDNFRELEATTMLFYAGLSNTNPVIAKHLKNTYRQAIKRDSILGTIRDHADPYRAYLNQDHYVWGSNRAKVQQGTLFINLETYQLSQQLKGIGQTAAQDYLHYLHGVNPLGIVYLSNMYLLGVERSVNEFYHSWFLDKSPRWDRVGESVFGPAPGYLVGGPNSDYAWDSCCPSNCGSSTNNRLCKSQSLSPPQNQPTLKAYKDFNTSWPLNSWSVTENSNSYQSCYVRLLSKFVPAVKIEENAE